MYNILSEEFDTIKKVSIGLVFVIKNNTYYLLDKYGEIAESYCNIEDFGKYVSYVKQIDRHHRQLGKISTEGEEYDIIDLHRTYQSDGYYTCKKTEKGITSYGYMDKEWNMLIPFIFSSIEPFYKDIAKVHICGKVALINKTISTSGEPHFIVKPFNGDIAVYKDRRFAKIINYELDGEGVLDTINEFEVIGCATQQYINRLRNEDIFVVKNTYGKQDVIINRYGQVLISCAYPNILIVGSCICVYRDYNEYEFYSKDGVPFKDIPNHYVEQFHKKLEDIESGSLYKYKRRRRRIYNDETPTGCGEGWSCSNCPNAGCPANELN